MNDCITAQKQGWAALTNGELIGLAETEFDVFITCDQNIHYQQNLQGCRIAILELSTNDLRRTIASGSFICSAIDVILPGAYVHLDIRDPGSPSCLKAWDECAWAERA